MKSCTSLALALFIAFAACPVRAGESDAPRSAEKADAALALFEQGKWDEALALFREAETLYHSPVYVLFTARCLENRGRFAEAKREYQRLVAEELPPKAPAPWLNAQEEGRTALGSLENRIPRVRIEVVSAPPDMRVSIDGNAARVGEDVQLDPGEHRIVAIAGSRRTSRIVTLIPSRNSIRVTLRFPEPGAPRKSERRNHDSAGGNGLNVPGLVLSAAGGATLIAGGVVGFIALKKADDAKADFPESCDGNTCPESRRGEVEDRTASARRFATISDGLFIGGGVLLAAGVVLLVVDPGAKPRSTISGSRAVVRF